MTRSQKEAAADVEDQLTDLLLEGESEAECPKCGLVYGAEFMEKIVQFGSSVMHVVCGMT